MIIADTSVWIEYLRGQNPDISEPFQVYLKKRKIVAVSAVFGELLQGVKNKREQRIVEGFWKHLPQLDEKDLFVEAGLLSRDYKLISKGVGLIDAYIISAALRHDLNIWTLDKKLDRVIDEVYFDA